MVTRALFFATGMQMLVEVSNAMTLYQDGKNSVCFDLEAKHHGNRRRVSSGPDGVSLHDSSEDIEIELNETRRAESFETFDNDTAYETNETRRRWGDDEYNTGTTCTVCVQNGENVVCEKGIENRLFTDCISFPDDKPVDLSKDFIVQTSCDDAMWMDRFIAYGDGSNHNTQRALSVLKKSVEKSAGLAAESAPELSNKLAEVGKIGDGIIGAIAGIFGKQSEALTWGHNDHFGWCLSTDKDDHKFKTGETLTDGSGSNHVRRRIANRGIVDRPKPSDCPQIGGSFKHTKLGSKCYYFQDRYVYYDDARNDCSSNGMKLAHPRNAEEDLFLWNEATKGNRYKKNTIWLGLRYDDNRDDPAAWYWNNFVKPQRGDYQNFAKGWPKNPASEQNERAVIKLREDGKWHTQKPKEWRNRQRYVCELDLTVGYVVAPAPITQKHLGQTTCGGNSAQGAQCQFPFEYKGTVWNSCTSIGHEKPWCYTNSPGNRKWGNCKCDDWKTTFGNVMLQDKTGCFRAIKFSWKGTVEYFLNKKFDVDGSQMTTTPPKDNFDALTGGIFTEVERLLTEKKCTKECKDSSDNKCEENCIKREAAAKKSNQERRLGAALVSLVPTPAQKREQRRITMEEFGIDMISEDESGWTSAVDEQVQFEHEIDGQVVEDEVDQIDWEEVADSLGMSDEDCNAYNGPDDCMNANCVWLGSEEDQSDSEESSCWSCAICAREPCFLNGDLE